MGQSNSKYASKHEQQQQRTHKRERIRKWMEKHGEKFNRHSEKAPDEFYKFADLPVELRVLIYKHYFASLKIDPSIDIRSIKPPDLLTACMEIRNEAFPAWIDHLKTLIDEERAKADAADASQMEWDMSFYAGPIQALGGNYKHARRSFMFRKQTLQLLKLMGREEDKFYAWKVYLQRCGYPTDLE